MRLVVIWDWDGTLVDSLEYKYSGIWADVFPGEPVSQELVREFLRTPEGRALNRYGLIRRALSARGDLPVDVSDDALKAHPEVRKYVSRYDRAARENASLFPGARAVLQSLRARGYRMYLVSGGGDDTTLREMAAARGVADCFRGIFGFGQPGAPLAGFGKAENLQRVFAQEGDPDPGRYVVVGDGEGDRAFALANGCRFIGIATSWNGWIGGGSDVVAAVEDVGRILP